MPALGIRVLVRFMFGHWHQGLTMLRKVSFRESGFVSRDIGWVGLVPNSSTVTNNLWDTGQGISGWHSAIWYELRLSHVVALRKAADVSSKWVNIWSLKPGCLGLCPWVLTNLLKFSCLIYKIPMSQAHWPPLSAPHAVGTLSSASQVFSSLFLRTSQ